jgi:excisionase family DNA binding protein
MATEVVVKAALSIDEAVVYLGIRRATLYRLLDSGEIKSFHIGRRRLIVRSELDRFIAQRLEAE